MKTFFPTSKSVRKMIRPARLNVANLRMTKEGIYSTTMPDQMLNIYKIVSRHLSRMGLEWRHMTVTDATANVGGSTIALALWARHVNAVEIDKTNYSALEFNIRAYGPKVVEHTTLYNKDYTKIHLRLRQDIIMIDPPWGRDHKLKSPQPMRLYLSKTPVVQIVNKLRTRARIITLKYPLNFDFSEFKRKLDPKFNVTCYQLPFMHYLVLECNSSMSKSNIENSVKNSINRVMAKRSSIKRPFARTV